MSTNGKPTKGGWQRLPVSFTLLLVLPLLVGCGEIIERIPQTPPSQTPPSGPPPSAAQAGDVSLSPRYAALGQGGSLQFNATVIGGGAVLWSVDGIPGGNATVGTVDANGRYTAPATLAQSVNVTLTAALPASPTTNYATSVVSLIQPGVVTETINPQVATYSMYLPAPGNVTIDFGQTSAYGLNTWSQTTPTSNGGEVGIEVAGMLGSAEYHMQAQVVLNDGATYSDNDRTFATGAPPPTASVTASAQNGATPQPGIELFDTLVPHEAAQAFATDLAGNVIWTYSYDGPVADLVQPVRQLPNGDFLVQISYASSAAVAHALPPSSTFDEVREVDLAGNTLWSLTEAQLASALNANTTLSAQLSGLQLGSLHHDVLPLPNGHLVLLLSATKSYTDLQGYPGTTDVLGDLLVDVDRNFSPDWVWNSFDHLDIARHPYLFPDWTHSNALLYSADDHNLLLSVRHQNWIVKIDFQDGTGSGNILWRLGHQGDFTLQNATAPTDWFYAQHGPSYFSPNTTGVFTLGVMDNGDDRQFPSGLACGAVGAPPCYSAADILQVDESKMVATMVQKYAPPSTYSFFGGNVAPLSNGYFEVDFCSVKSGAVVQDLQIGTQNPVWQATTPGAYQYRTDRLPSFYPGVQW